MQTEIKIGINTINKMVAKKRTRDYAAFLYLKSICKKGCYFNYTQERLAKLSEMSRTSTGKYVKKFIKYGWCHMHNGNLIFKGLKHFPDKEFNKRYTIIPSRIITRTVKMFYLIILKHKQSQFNKLKEFSRDAKDPSNLKAYKRALKFGLKHNLKADKGPLPNERMRISLKKLSTAFNCSLSKTGSVVRSLKYAGKLEVFSKTQRMMRTTRAVANRIIEPGTGYYFAGKSIFKVSCNEYEVAL